jgi:hypothetical protein
VNDAEIISTWMEPEPSGAPRPFWQGWWLHDGAGWHARPLTLTDLWDVEERLIQSGVMKDMPLAGFEMNLWSAYIYNLTAEVLDDAPISVIHATPEQKIKALAAVLRPIVEKGGTE